MLWDIVHVSVAGNPPLTFEECLKSLRKTTIGNPSLCTTSMVKLSLQNGDCYSGIHSQERSKLAVLQKKLKDLEGGNNLNQNPRGRGVGH